MFFKASSNFWGLNDGFLSHEFKSLSQCQSQEGAGHSCQLWTSDFSYFPNFKQVIIIL